MSSPTVVKSAKSWKVKSPPVKATDVGGKMVPTVKGAFRVLMPSYKRRVTLEVHGNVDDDKDNDKGDSHHHHHIRPSQRIVDKLPDELLDEDRAILRIWKKQSARDRDDSSSSGDDDSHSDGDDDGDSTASLEEDGEWVEYRRYFLDEIDEDVDLHKHSWEATLGRAAKRERREFKFSSSAEAEDFNTDIKRFRKAAENRASVRLEEFKEKQKEAVAKADKKVIGSAPKLAAKSSVQNLGNNSNIRLLIQIVSASDLPIADLKTSDPYINAYLGQKKLHRTKTVANNLDPVYTLEQDCFFLLDCPAKEFFAAATGVTFLVKDDDRLGSNDSLAKVDITQNDLLAMNGERTEHVLKVERNLKTPSVVPPKLVIRCRKAEERDIKFLDKIGEHKKLHSGIFAEYASLSPKSESVGLLKSESKTKNGAKVYRTKPHPDPKRDEDETKWLSVQELEREMMKPSTRWIEAGSGKLGKAYIEIIKCEGLPSLDIGLTGKGKSDPFICMLFEDAIVNTDVINDCLSPKFMPWSTRAFVLNREHASSQVHLAVLDYDSGNHGRIGRISVDLTDKTADTEYLLTYNLFKSVLDNERPVNGKITIRLRLEYSSYRSVALGSLKLPPSHKVNTSDKRDWYSSYFVVNGEENLNALDMEALKSYQTELMEYGHVLPVVANAVKNILLWRGTFRVGFGKNKAALPVHSLTAFVLGVMLVENYNYLPAFSLFAIAWLFLATNEHRQHHPSPWRQPLTFSEMWIGMITGKMPKVDIDPLQNEGAIRKYQEEQAAQVKKNEEQAKKAQAQANKLSEFTTQPESADDEDADTSMGGGLNLNPMSFILLPVQKILTSVCLILRVVTGTLTWDEPIFGFFLVNGCIVGGLVLMLVPWSFFIRWTLRIVVWVFLGPWMKLVDIHFVRKLEEEGDNDTKKYAQQLQAATADASQGKKMLMMTKENIQSMTALRKYYFGKFLVTMPRFKSFRYADYPLMESEAHPVKNKPQVMISERKYGQTLEGYMIPKWAGEDAAYSTDRTEI